jgi:hypothetical protein
MVLMRYVYRAAATQDALIGTLHDIDRGRQTITISTPRGLEMLSLPSWVSVHQGAKTLSIRDLSAHQDERVKVWFRRAGDTRTATEVRLAVMAR